VKVKINPNSFEDEDSAARALCAAVAGLEHVWTIGHTMLFFRPSRTHDTRYPLPA
jgi:RNA-binding protein